MPAGYDTSNNITIRIEWPNSVADYDLYVLDQSGAVIRSAASSSDPETAVITAIAGQYTVRIVPFAPLGETVSASASLTAKPAVTAPGTDPAPVYRNYAGPSTLKRVNDAGEPSIGANWKSGKVLYQAYTATYRVTFDDSIVPAAASWQDKSAPTSITSLDPILFTDSRTGRTVVSQLAGKTSLSSFTDDDGETWTPSQGAGINSRVDHQTIGGGPFAPGVVGPIGAYPDAVYYCSQDIADALCALSRDGGLTYGPAVPIYSLLDCGGLHGHVKVAPDGTVYVPNKGCAGQQGLALSTDNGTTWAVRKVPGSLAGNSDPSIGVGANDTIYFGYANGDGHARIAVSHDRGQTWENDQDVGAAFGIQNVVFPAVVAGDDDRAAFAFLGTPAGGNYQDQTNFHGVWHLYVAHTFDGGKTWVTSDATPNDPVQRGSICTGGTTCGDDRNLLDFMDITVDKQGRVLVGYADGCVDACVQSEPNSGSAWATIAREETGRRLFAQYDQVDLTPTNLVAYYQKPKETVLTATVANNGTAPTRNVVVRFLDGTTVLGESAPIAYLPAGGTADASFTWSTKGIKGSHMITAIVDPANAIAESNEDNNTLQRSLPIR